MSDSSRGLSIIDSHAHVVREYFPDDQDEVIQRALGSGVVQMVNPAVVANNVAELLELSTRYQQIFVAVGVHPHEAKDWSDDVEEELREASRNERVVAIGECGLDFYYNHSDRQAQLHALKRQIAIALDCEKPIIIHCRDAWDEVMDILEEHGQGRLRGVFHCFTGGPEHLPRIDKLGFFISFSGIVTFPNAKNIQAAAKEVRLDRILVETDCPYLAPQKVRGKRNEPSYVWHVAEKLAELRAQPLESICDACCNNTRTLFNLPAPV